MNSFKRINLNFSKRESILLYLVIAGLFYLHHLFWQAPHNLKLELLHSQVASSRKKIEANQSLLQKLAKQEVNINKMNESTEILEKYVKSNDRFSNVVTGIVTSSKNDAFLLTKISTEKQSKYLGYTQTLYNVEVESSFISIGKFLERLEDSSLLTEVEGIEITRLENEMKRVKASIKLFSYVAGGTP